MIIQNFLKNASRLHKINGEGTRSYSYIYTERERGNEEVGIYVFTYTYIGNELIPLSYFILLRYCKKIKKGLTYTIQMYSIIYNKHLVGLRYNFGI